MKKRVGPLCCTLFVLAAAIGVIPACSFGVWVSDGNSLCVAVGNQYGPSITPDGEGGAIVAWEDYRSGTADIYVQRINALGEVQWAPDGVALSTASGNQYAPRITSDNSGGAIVTWADYRGAANIYVQRVSASGVAQWTPDGVALCTAAALPGYPRIAADGAGGAIATWNDERSGFMKDDIYVQRVSASGAVEWTPNGVALCNATDIQFAPEIMADGEGGAIVVWEDYRSGNYDIFVQRIDNSGAVEWTVDGVALCSVSGDQRSPAITSDGVGGAIVAWDDGRSNNFDIYAQRIDSQGHLIDAGPVGSRSMVWLLEQNFPNPFNPVTVIRFTVARTGAVRLVVYDVSGRLVHVLADEVMRARTYEVIWNGEDERGLRAASGFYTYVLNAPGYTETRKMLLVR